MHNKYLGDFRGLFAFACWFLAYLCLLSQEAISGECGEQLKYSFEGDTLTISGIGPMRSSMSFHLNKSLVYKVIIEYGATTIGSYAFIDFINLSCGVTNISNLNELKQICESLLSKDVI